MSSSSFANLIVRFTKVWEDFVEVEWKRQVFDGRRVVKYHLTAVAKDYRVERFFEAGDTKFRLAGLLPATDIEVNVRVQLAGAESEAEWSTWQGQSTTTLAAASIEVTAIRPTSLHGNITWGLSPLLRDGPTTGAVPLLAENFEVKVEQRGRVMSHTLPVQHVPFSAESPESRAFEVTNVDKNATFYVQVRAISVYADRGRWSTPTKFISLDPVAVDIVNIAENEVTLEWGRGEDDDQTMSDGAIDEIVVIVEQIPDQRELDLDANATNTRVDAQMFANEVRRYNVKNLHPGRHYVLRSRYRNTLGNHSEWSITPFRTLYPVAPVDVQLVGHNFIQVKWARDVPADAPIRCAREGVGEWEVRCSVGSASTSVRLPVAEMETKLMNLLHGVDYTVDVRAITPFGHAGPWCPAVAVTTLHRLVPRVPHSGESWLQINWDRKEKRYEDNIERYHLQVNCATSPYRIAKYFPATTTAYQVDNLKPNTTYIVMIQAYSDDRWGPWSEPVTIRTCAPCTPLLARRGEDFVLVRWRSEYYERCAVDSTQQKYQVSVKRAVEEGGAPTESQVMTLDSAAHRFNHLPAFSRLVLRVRVFDYTLQAWCGWGDETEFRTLPAVIVLTRIGETHCEISWPRVPRLLSAVSDEEAAQHAEDALAPDPAQQYVIRVNRVDANKVHREVAKHHFDGTDSTSFAVTELKADHDYSVQLSYLDVHGRWSSDSSPVCFRTLPPLRVAVRDVGEGYAVLRWGRWQGGTELLARPEDADLNYRIQLVRVLTPEEEAEVGSSTATPKQYNVPGRTSYVVTDLEPSALYRVHVSCASKSSNVWGVWSEPAYLITTAAAEMALDVIGQDFAFVSWQRPERTTDALRQLPNARFALADFNDRNPLPSVPVDEADGGYVVHYGDDTVTEHHLHVYRIDPPREPELDPSPTRTLIFDAKQNPGETTVRVGGLEPNAQYEAAVRSHFLSKHWGVWAAPLVLRTTMPTQVRVTAITQDGLEVSWGHVARYADGSEVADAGADHANAAMVAMLRATEVDTVRHQLVVRGIDDEFELTQEIDGSVFSHVIRGLRPNSAYSFTVRSFLRSDDDWGAWCEKLHVQLSTTALDLVEASQDWLHVKWAGKPPPDGRPKTQFLTVVGQGRATIVTLGAAANSHVIRDLTPNTQYVAHMLCVEQCPSYMSEAEVRQRRSSKAARSEKSGGRSGGADGERSVRGDGGGRAAAAPGGAMEGFEPVSFSLPLVAADTTYFLSSGILLRTHRMLHATIDRVGQNFVLVRWSAAKEEHEAGLDLHLPGELFEVETAPVDGREEPKYQRAQGSYVFVRHLKPDSEVRCAVRTVASRTDCPCRWSNGCSVRLLPMIDPILGPGDGTDVPGVGEDYAIVNWSRALATFSPERLQGISFEVRVTPLEGPQAHVEQTYDTAQPRLHCRNLLPDTKYQVQVRTVIAHRSSNSDGAAADDVAKGEWSRPLVLTTLSPMAVALVGITETTATAHWRRRNCAVSDQWWCDADRETVQSEIATISSFHVRITEASADPAAPAFFDEQFGEHHQEFQACAVALKGLRADTAFHVRVRASTGRLWGGWSDPVTFHTTAPVLVAVASPGESNAIVSWERPAVGGNSPPPAEEASDSKGRLRTLLAPVTSWEVRFVSVNAESTAATITAEIDSQHTLQRIGGLTANTPYGVCVRATYGSAVRGPWSEPAYCVTLPPLRVDVGKVGETFVNVSWCRDQQTTISGRLKARSIDGDRRLDAQLRELEEERELALREGGDDAGSASSAAGSGRNDDEAPVGLDDMLDSPEAEAKPAAAGAAGSGGGTISKLQRLAAIDRRIADVNAKAKQARQLLNQHCAELERAAVYGKGDDIRYELVVHIGAEGVAPPLRKRLGRGEDRYRLENLTPKTNHVVTVRALHQPAPPLEQHAVPPHLNHGIGDIDEDTRVPWGDWSARTHFTTLKPITIKAHGVGSTSFSVEWDTGIDSKSGSSTTAISKFQIHCHDVVKQQQAIPDVVLHDRSLKGHVLQGLAPSTVYSISVRVCYEGDKWGVWSTAVQFVTLPPLVAKLESTGERNMDFLVWRDVPPAVDEASTLYWRQPVTQHQLAINEVPCDDTFEIEEGTSTHLTLDTLSLDTEYAISIRDLVDGTWQDFRPALVSETLPHVPQRPTLVERKGTSVAIAWEHRRLLTEKQYLYMVEIALLNDPEQGRRSDIGAFQTLGFTTALSFRLELPYPIHACVFRVRAAKTNLTVDGTPLYVNGFVPGKLPAPEPAPVAVDNPHLYRWSGYSPVAHFKTPSVPDHPTGIHVRNLTHNAALLRWSKPANAGEHTQLVYRVYLNNSYIDKFTCIGETTTCSWDLHDLVPNTHYRVAVTAESTMGRSTNNNTLHFSTRNAPAPGEVSVYQPKPMASTLPPRTAIRPPAVFAKTAAKERASRGNMAEEVGDVLIDDAGSTIFSIATRANTAPGAARDRSPPKAAADDGAVASGRRPGTNGGRSALQQKKKAQLPPLPSDAHYGK